MREVEALLALQEYPNIVKLLDVMRDEESDSRVYLVFELMATDLRHLIMKHAQSGRPQGLGVYDVLSFTKQLLRAVQHIHSRGMAHRDIKSHNILIGEPGSFVDDDGNRGRMLKVADFGLSRVIASPPKPMTKEICTLNWRAPEVMLDNLRYSPAVDMWSIGVVLHEMITGMLPFEGSSEIEVLFSIFRKKGTPSEHEAVFFTRSPVLRLYVAALPKFETKNAF